MKKNLLILSTALCCFLLSSGAIAQNFGIVLFEDFDAATTPTDWTQVVSPTPPAGASTTVVSTGWAFGEGPYTSTWWTVPASLDATPFAISNDDAADQDKSQDLLMSPVMNLSGFDSVDFLFERFYDGQWSSLAEFWISYDAGANWLTIPIGADPAWIQDGFRIANNAELLVGQTFTFNDQMMIGFLHNDDGAFASGFAVDNVVVGGYNNPCDDIVTIPACDVPQTVSLGGVGTIDWEFTTGCGFTTFGQEQLYSFTPTVSGVHTLDVTAAAGNSWIDYMWKPASAGCDTVGWNCLADVIAEGSFGMNLTAGVEYYILADNEFIDTETQTFEISCPCTYTSLGGTPEGEICGNTNNDGCALAPGSETFGSISNEETISGTTFADGGFRDIDYYEFTLGSDATVAFDFGGGLPLNAAIIDNCTDFNVLADATSFACQTSTLSYAATAGTYYLVILPTAFDAYPCGAPEAIYDVSMDVSCPENPDAGTITSNGDACLDAGSAVISATPDGNSNVPAGYSVLYVLTDADNGLVIVDAQPAPSFTVTNAGNYIIHTLVYDPTTVNPGLLPPGTTGFDVNGLLVQGGGTICGSLDVTGALVSVDPVCAPANDLCGGAVQVTCGSTTSGTTVGSTANDAPFGTAYVSEGVWYVFAGTGDEVTASTCDAADFDTEIVIATGSCGNLTYLANNDDDFLNCTGNTSQVTFDTEVGTDYYIYVGDYFGSDVGPGGNEGTFDLTITCTPPPPAPDGDDVCDPIALSIGLNGPFTNVGATVEGGEALPGSGTGANTCQSQDGWCSFALTLENTIWMTFVAPASGNVIVSTDNSDFDSQLAVYAAGSCQDLLAGSGTLLGANDDNPDATVALTSEVVLCGLTPGTTYYVQVDGYASDGSDVGDFVVNITETTLSADFFESSTGLVVDFTDDSGASTSIVSWAWDFGDGNTSADEDPSHTYAADGTYTVCLTVTDENGCTSEFCTDVTVADIPTSIAEAVDRSMNVYPNPSNGEFVVEINGVDAAVQLNVLDLSGRMVYTEGAVLNGNFRKDLNLDMAAGTYLLQIATEEGLVTRKIQIH